ncbi:hypothetical protein QQF64_024183 [Cirrhinus molitorella]|uniref:Uncharacterized protein n=1 Tax=Cirrhinus molitorella TaxID=172907 RepID=A0ABR3NLQ8_9TELE
MADPGGLKLSAPSQKSNCSLSRLSLIFFSFHGFCLLTALPPFFSPVRTVEQCSTRRHAFDRYPLQPALTGNRFLCLSVHLQASTAF